MYLYIKNGRVVDPKSGTDGLRDILCRDGKVLVIEEAEDKQPLQTSRIGKALESLGVTGTLGSGKTKTQNGEEITVIDAAGMIVAPGLVDVHSHFRDPGQTAKEDMHTGAEAAAAGGYTSIVLMANTVPTVDNPETLAYVLKKAGEQKIRIHTCANVTMGMEGKILTDMETLRKQGATGFTDDGKPILEEAVLREAMKRCAALQVPISLHEEDPAYIGVAGVNEGAVSAEMGIKGADRKAEMVMVERDLKIALETGAILDIQHISAAESVELVRKAKDRERSVRGESICGQPGKNGTERAWIHAEATPQHFTLTEDMVREKGTLAKVNPPLRTEADRQAIIKGLADGTIDLIATDHAPHTAEEKSREFPKAPSGMIGLETALSLGVRELVNTGVLSLMELLRKMTVNPAGLYSLDAGYIAEGGPADFCIFDPDKTYVYGEYQSRSSNSPFTGQEGPAPVEYTVCRGQIVYRRDN